MRVGAGVTRVVKARTPSHPTFIIPTRVARYTQYGLGQRRIVWVCASARLQGEEDDAAARGRERRASMCSP